MVFGRWGDLDCVAFIFPALLGPATPASPSGVVLGSAGKDGRLVAFPGGLYAAGLRLGLFLPLSAPSVGGLWTKYLCRPPGGNTSGPIGPSGPVFP